MSLKEPKKHEAEKPIHWQNFARRADRLRIAFRAAARSCFTKKDHQPSAAMSVDHRHVFRRGLMKTVVIVGLHQVIPIDGRSSRR